LDQAPLKIQQNVSSLCRFDGKTAVDWSLGGSWNGRRFCIAAGWNFYGLASVAGKFAIESDAQVADLSGGREARTDGAMGRRNRGIL
jgi:hypothetical protein